MCVRSGRREGKGGGVISLVLLKDRWGQEKMVLKKYSSAQGGCGLKTELCFWHFSRLERPVGTHASREARRKQIFHDLLPTGIIEYVDEEEEEEEEEEK